MESRHGKLWLGGVRARELTEAYGSPLFVIEEDRIRESYRRLAGAFSHPAVRMFYAVKANPNVRVLQVLRDEGAGADCCSVGEVHVARRAGFTPEEISFTGTGLTAPEAQSLAEGQVPSNVDSLSQLERCLPLFSRSGLGIRINPGSGTGLHASCTTGGKDSKLGIPIEHAAQARAIARRIGGRIAGLHVHTGSGGLDATHFCDVARTMFSLAEEFAPQLEYIDLGGGIGVPHAPGERPFDLDSYAREACGLLDDWNRRHSRSIELYIEPGQFLVAQAGWLLMTLVVRKETPHGKRFLITDSSFNHYLGTALYQSYHTLLAADDLTAPAQETVDVCGHLCNTGDTFARDRSMPRLQEGDLLAMDNAGAYGSSRAANYNSRPIPAEVLVTGGEARLIRRRQTLDDLLLWQE
jgi:diaminopimelate decarboxylase